MRSIPGTITDPAMDKFLPHATRLEGIFDTPPLTLDEYQEGAASTAIYPRVYTEDQVRQMLAEILYRQQGFLDDIDAVAINQLLDDAETPFNRLVYPLLGLAGEVGEILNKAKKVARDNQGKMDLEAVETATDELSDVQWYVAAIATELGVKLGDVGRANLDKLASRKSRGVLGGSGDNR